MKKFFITIMALFLASSFAFSTASLAAPKNLPYWNSLNAQQQAAAQQAAQQAHTNWNSLTNSEQQNYLEQQAQLLLNTLSGQPNLQTGPKNCPPGQAKKGNCFCPPGQAKKGRC